MAQQPQGGDLSSKLVTNPSVHSTPSIWSAPFCRDLAEHLAAERQIAALRADKAVVDTMLADSNIIDEQLAVEASIGEARSETAACQIALNDSSWGFFEGTVGNFESYTEFAKRARAYMKSRLAFFPSSSEAIHEAETLRSAKGKETITIEISDDEE